MFCWKFKVTRYKVMGKLKSFFFFFELFLAAHVCTPFSSLVQVYVQCFLKSCLHVFVHWRSELLVLFCLLAQNSDVFVFKPHRDAKMREKFL